MKQERKRVLISVIMVMAILCTACGTKLPEAGDYAGTDSASGSAAGSDGDKADVEKKESIYERLRYCNDKYCYQLLEEEIQSSREPIIRKILQSRLVGGVEDNKSLRTFSFPEKLKDVIQWRVNNREILVSNRAGELWCIPLGSDKEGECPLVDKAEKVLTDKNGVTDMYATEEYILYTSYDGCSVYNEYDRRTGKKLSVSREESREFTTYGDHDILDVISGEYILLGSAYEKMDKADEGSDQVQEGVYIHRLGSGSVTKIDDLCNFESAQIAYDGVRATGNKFYYYGSWERDKTNEIPEYTMAEQAIKMYDTLTGKRETFVSNEQLRQEIVKNKILLKDNYLYVGGIYLDGERMYILAFTASEYFMFSRPLDGSSELQYEKKVSKFLNKEVNGYTRLIEKDIIDGKLLVSYEDDKYVDDIRYLCYDLAKGTYKDLCPGDKELAYWQYGSFSIR